MTENPDILDIPPFPKMEWTECEWWEGVIDLATGQDADLSVTRHHPAATRVPSEPQRDA